MSDNITPSGYIYGRDPKQTNPFWDMNKFDEKELQDRRWFGVEKFPENYEINISLENASADSLNRVGVALSYLNIDYLTLDYAYSRAPYFWNHFSGKRYTIKRSNSLSLFLMPERTLHVHELVYEDCISSNDTEPTGGPSEISPHIVKLINVYANINKTQPFSLYCSVANPSKIEDHCLVLINEKNIYRIMSVRGVTAQNSVDKLKVLGITIFVEDDKYDLYLADQYWGQLSSQIKPLSEFHEEDW